MTSQDLVQQQRDGVAFIDEPKLRTEIADVLPATVSEAQFVRAFKNAVISDPTGNLMKADRVSLYQAVLRSAMAGLLPDNRDAVILPFYDNKTKGFKAQFIPMISGQRKIAGEYGWALVAYVVYANDGFDPDLESHRANHKPTKLGQERGAIIGAYAIAEHRDGRKVGPVIMDVAEIEKVRKKSKQPDGQLWTEWYDQACIKTVAKRAMKEIPWDSKDREHIDRLLAEDTNGDDAIDLLYGDRPAPLPKAAPAARAGESIAADDSPPTNVDLQTGEILDEKPPLADDDIPFGEPEFEGEEPTDDEPLEGEVVEEPTFGGKKYAGKTVQEVWESGDESYVRWARRNWKTGDIVGALERFAQEHPEIDE